jgi:hypothetical protein
MSDEEFGLARRRPGGFVVVSAHVDLKSERKVMELGDAWLVEERVGVSGGRAIRRRRS